MDTDKKIEYILATVQKGYSQRQIDIDGKGGFFIRLRRGNPPKQVTLDRIYARCLELRTIDITSSNDDSKPQEQTTSKDTTPSENERSIDENAIIQRENQLIPNPIFPTNDPTSLLRTIQELEKKVTLLEKTIARQEKELAKFRLQIGTEKLQITFLDTSIPQQNHMDNITSCNQTNINQITPSSLCNPYNSNQITPLETCKPINPNQITQLEHCNPYNSNQITPSKPCQPDNSNQITISKDDDFQQTMLYGFVLKTKLVKNRIYWYAYRWDGTKDIWLYIGTDKNQATAKIEKYLSQA